MSNFLIALLLALGCSGWIYSKIQRRTGGNTKTAVIAAGACGVGILIITWGILGLLAK